MTGPSHMVGAALAGLAAAALYGADPAGGFALVVGSVAASRLSDVDAEPLPVPAHRNLPHSLLLGGRSVLVTALALFAWLSSGGANETLGGEYLPSGLSRGVLGFGAIGFALGYLSPLALGALTVSGIWLAVPGGTKLKPPKRCAVRTGGLRGWWSSRSCWPRAPSCWATRSVSPSSRSCPDLCDPAVNRVDEYSRTRLLG